MEEDKESREDRLFGIPIQNYIKSEEVKDTRENKSTSPEHACPLDLAAKKIEGTIDSLSTQIHKTLARIVEKFSSAGLDIRKATALDIDGLSLREEIFSLRKLYGSRKENEKSRLRLKMGESSTALSNSLQKMASTAQLMSEWSEKLSAESKKIEENVLKRSETHEIRAGVRVAEKHREAVEEVQRIEKLCATIEEALQAKPFLSASVGTEETSMAESFIRLTSEEDKTVSYLLSVYPAEE
ncbi:hypothetical protein NECID01_1740 [Nematocida sp. AWRm77]|nr:hypothetical protein NECID01_1740 [Nematocida sp. AWRm77]